LFVRSCEKSRYSRGFNIRKLQQTARNIGLAWNTVRILRTRMRPSGTGKTSMALALCEAIGGELHHIPSQSCNVSTVEDVTRQCHYVPRNNTLHIVLVDESDQMSSAAQLSFLSKLDGTAFPPQTVFIFTANDTERLQDRFLSRCMVLQFQSHGMAKEAASLLERIWQQEAGEAAEKPNFLRMVQDSKNNVRDAVNSLQVELLSV